MALVTDTTTLVVTTLLAVLLVKVGLWFTRYRRWAAQYYSLPGTDGHWLLGHLKEHPGNRQDGLDYLHSFTKAYPRFHKFWFTRFQCAMIFHHPDTVRILLKNSAFLTPKPRQYGTFYRMALPWLGEGLLLANGDLWARDRRLLTPAFHFAILHKYVPVLNETTGIFLGKIGEFADRDETFELYSHTNLLTLDSMMRCTMSYVTDCQKQGENHLYVKTVNMIARLWALRCLNPVYYLDWIYYNLTWSGRQFLKHCDYVHSIAENIIKSRRRILERQVSEDDSKRPVTTESRVQDFLDVLLNARDEDGRGLTDLEIRNEVDTFMFEGHDTTGSAISFTLLSLAQSPQIQRRVQEELDGVLEGRESDDIKWEDLGRLDYLSLCIKEGLRMHSPVFYMQRSIEEDMAVDGHRIPRGTPISLNIYNLHHNPQVWGQDHMDFKPERFHPDNVERMDPFAFVPFSGGQRNCIGQNFAMNEMKIAIGKLLYRFNLEVEPNYQVNKLIDIVMRPENGIRMKAKRRK